MRYEHHFANGPGGWYGWQTEGAAALQIRDGAAISSSPWWVDYNHAPPGAGYLHILYALNTRSDDADVQRVAGANHFLTQGFPRNFINARFTLRLRGDLQTHGAQLVLLVQSDITAPVRTRVNSVLTGQPIAITRAWSEQSFTCVPDNGQWTCLGSRHNRFDTYGWGPIAPVLRDVTCDIIFVLFPLQVASLPPSAPGADIHLKRAGRDYAVDPAPLPSGSVELQSVAIDFPAAAGSM